MAQHAVDLAQMRPELTELVDQAARSGEEVVLTREGEAVAKIVPLVRQRKPRRFGSARGQLIVPDDFDAPLEDFRDYM
ncbi:MAG: type II toxin-antitoxin system Phd/YefM family antitoxin [Longimicrobiaceae bacterium]